MRKELVQDAEPVEYGGKRFFRAEFKQSVRDDVFYVGHVYTTFRGYFVGEDFVARSPEEMDKTADTLKGISFREDERNPRCVEDSAPAGRVRLSETASQVFLITKIEPVYPPEARQTRVEGQVVLRILIGTTGDVEDTHLVSGDPLLVPAAMEAVKQWKYRPFLIGSEPAKMDTQTTVSFTLAAN
jgi:TonB family protein